jgi:hypothetical protein
MKRLILGLFLATFLVFGALSVQNIYADSFNVEIVNFDKDPKKDGKKEVTAKSNKASAKNSKECCAKDSKCCDESKKKECCSTKAPSKDSPKDKDKK